jgi:ribosomal protein S18 acetylase RimI-like enzyme
VPGAVIVELVEPSAVRPLRREVLRPGRPADESIFEGDDDPLAAHVAVRTVAAAGTGPTPGAETLAVGTIHPEPPPWEPVRSDGWRIRGMATRASDRGRGLGRTVLNALLGHAAKNGGGVVWCNARVTAVGLYLRHGFVVQGEQFVVPDIGPHLQMWRTIEASS